MQDLYLTFLDSTTSCESDYLASTDRENYCGLLFLFSKEISPAKESSPDQVHATEAQGGLEALPIMQYVKVHANFNR